jgi:translation initiation factor RLI1
MTKKKEPIAFPSCFGTCDICDRNCMHGCILTIRCMNHLETDPKYRRKTGNPNEGEFFSPNL